jgi:hypothetical protein
LGKCDPPDFADEAGAPSTANEKVATLGIDTVEELIE